MPGVGRQSGWDLRIFGAYVTQAFDNMPYQVGSSLDPERKWRDVDVRLILPDDEYQAFFGDPMTPAHNAPKLMMWDYAWSALGHKVTRLPIDFQFQQQTLANEQFSGPRSALLVMDDEFPTVRSAEKGKTT